MPMKTKHHDNGNKIHDNNTRANNVITENKHTTNNAVIRSGSITCSLDIENDDNIHGLSRRSINTYYLIRLTTTYYYFLRILLLLLLLPLLPNTTATTTY